MAHPAPEAPGPHPALSEGAEAGCWCPAWEVGALPSPLSHTPVSAGGCPGGSCPPGMLLPRASSSPPAGKPHPPLARQLPRQDQGGKGKRQKWVEIKRNFSRQGREWQRVQRTEEDLCLRPKRLKYRWFQPALTLGMLPPAPANANSLHVTGGTEPDLQRIFTHFALPPSAATPGCCPPAWCTQTSPPLQRKACPHPGKQLFLRLPAPPTFPCSRASRIPGQRDGRPRVWSSGGRTRPAARGLTSPQGPQRLYQQQGKAGGFWPS